MKAKQLHEALNLVRTAIPAKSPREICETVRIWIVGGEVQLRGTNLEVAMETTFHVEPDAQCRRIDLCVKADLLAAIVREAGDVEMQLGVEEGASPKLLINYPGAEIWLNALPGAEFPEVPKADGTAVEMESAGLLDLLRKTAFAAARNSMRFAMEGVLLAGRDGRLDLAATDGHRLALASAACEVADGQRFVLPGRSVPAIAALLATGARARLVFGADCLTVSVGDSTMASRQIEGTFPNYRDVIPRNNDRAITIGKKELTTAVRQAAVLTSDDSKAVRVDAASGMIDVTGQTLERGKGRAHRIALFDGAKISVAFDPALLLDFLRVFDEDQVHIKIGKADGAVLFHGEDQEKYLYLVMPIKLED